MCLALLLELLDVSPRRGQVDVLPTLRSALPHRMLHVLLLAQTVTASSTHTSTLRVHMQALSLHSRPRKPRSSTLARTLHIGAACTPGDTCLVLASCHPQSSLVL